MDGYSRIPTRAGRNHIPLAGFLTSTPQLTTCQPHLPDAKYVTLYALDLVDVKQRLSSLSPPPKQQPSESDVEPDFADERRHDRRNCTSFNDPQVFFQSTSSRPRSQSCIIFLRGFMIAAWINQIGAYHVVDPEFFCRHLDFQPADDNSNDFSLPALPSASWHLIELPVITVGTRRAHKGVGWT